MKKFLSTFIFLSSAFCFCVTYDQFISIAYFADEFCTSPIAIYGGQMENLFSWIELLLLAVTTLASFILTVKIFKEKK